VRRAASLLALLAASALAAERPEETLGERDAVARVVSAIEGKDCALATRRLNEGLADQYPGIVLMTGAMLEDGICLKPNWMRASQMYQRALALGHHGGQYKLIAGNAYQNRDPALALWWSQEGIGLRLPAPCVVPDWVHDDPAAYAATVTAWPGGRLQACAYAAGVLATVAGDAEYPPTALDFQMAGRVEMEFVPATGTITWRTLELQDEPMRGLTSGDMLQDRKSRKVQDSLRSYLQVAGERALKRFERPEGVDPAWHLRSEYVFRIRSR
jgi:hypothetical protein